ncbi:MAG: PilN domain-containing protein [Gammaproteobacteria bacterium]|jgi:general secretion pathway protein L|nr:PilN domain-containing protein [Gammaproteobacteria bacterium]
MLPQRLLRLTQTSAANILIRVQDQEAVFILSEAELQNELIKVDLQSTSPWDQHIRKIVRSAGDKNLHEVVIEVPDNWVLNKKLTLPSAAKENLREVLAFEMDRQTPFTADQVYYDFDVLGEDRANDTLTIALHLAPRRALDPLLENIGECGLKATKINVAAEHDHPAGHHICIALHDHDKPNPSKGNGARANQILKLLTVILGVIAIALPLVKDGIITMQLKSEATTARDNVSTVEETHKMLQTQLIENSRLAVIKREQPGAMQVLDELTRILPDNTWVSRLEIHQPRVNIRGESSNAANLSTLIESSPFFSNTQFDSSVTRDTITGQENFSISANIQHGSQP